MCHAGRVLVICVLAPLRPLGAPPTTNATSTLRPGTTTSSSSSLPTCRDSHVLNCPSVICIYLQQKKGQCFGLRLGLRVGFGSIQRNPDLFVAPRTHALYTAIHGFFFASWSEFDANRTVGWTISKSACANASTLVTSELKKFICIFILYLLLFPRFQKCRTSGHCAQSYPSPHGPHGQPHPCPAPPLLASSRTHLQSSLLQSSLLLSPLR